MVICHSSLRLVKGLFIVLALLLSLIPLSSASVQCPCDDLDTCTEWVSHSTPTVKWGQIYETDVNGVHYTIRADDFDVDDKGALIVIEKNGKLRNEFLFKDAAEDSWFQWDHEIRVKLTDVTVDSAKVPSASLEILKRGRPSLTITIDSTAQTIDDISVAADKFLPGEEKEIIVTVKNPGDAWIERVVLQVNIGELELKSWSGLDYEDKVITEEMGCLASGVEKQLSFVVIVPEWDGATSPYDIQYTVQATSSGNDIKGDTYSAAAQTKIFTHAQPQPLIKIKKELTDNEINMTSWYARKIETDLSSGHRVDYDIWGAWEYTFLRTTLYNTGLYPVENARTTFADIPNELFIAEIFESGEPSTINPDQQYYLGQKLIPLKSGTYTIGKTVVQATYFGKEFSWESGSLTLNVHGAHIVLDKSISDNGDGSYTVGLTVRNDGDRAATVDITDAIPVGVNYVGGSIEPSIPGSTNPLGKFDLDFSRDGDVQLINVKGKLLAGESLSMSYKVTGSSLATIDLPYAVCYFRSPGEWREYNGTVQSSFIRSGSKVTQTWDVYEGWQFEGEYPFNGLYGEKPDPEPVVLLGEEQSEEEKLPAPAEIEPELEVVHEPTVAPENTTGSSWFGTILGPFGSIFENIQSIVGDTFGAQLEAVGGLFGTVEGAAINLAENYLYAIVIVIALIAFGIVYSLITR